MPELEDDETTQLAIEVVGPVNGSPVVRVAGELDISNADELASVVESVLADSPACLNLDVAALEFMDSSGLAVLLQAAGRTRVRLAQPQATVVRLLKVSGVSAMFEVEP